MITKQLTNETVDSLEFGTIIRTVFEPKANEKGQWVEGKIRLHNKLLIVVKPPRPGENWKQIEK